MIEFRIGPDDMPRKDLRFIGGTENFDLWFRTQIGPDVTARTDRPLRIQRVAGGSINWDIFKLPLRKNTEVGTSLPPQDRGVAGYWGDVILSWDDVEIIEAYLRCFAPWLRENPNDAA